MTTSSTLCTYIGTDGSHQGTCTHNALAGKNYCADHYAMVYQKGSGKRRKKDTRQAQRVQLILNLMHEACDELEAEGFDVYNDTELIQTQPIAETEEA